MECMLLCMGIALLVGIGLFTIGFWKTAVLGLLLGLGVFIGGVTNKVMEASQHIRVVIYLLLSAAGCLAGGVIGFIRCRELETHMAELEKKA